MSLTAPSPARFAVQATGLVRAFGDRRALDALTVEVPPGGVFGLLGPNGSGKSTFLGVVSGLDQPTAGSIHVLGHVPSRQLRAKLGVVFQENTHDPLLRPRELLRLAAALFGLRGEAATRRADRVLELVGLAARANDPISSLSGGMRRRLEVARALLHEPELLVFDEPTTGIDPEERRALWDALRAARTREMTVLLATNDLAEADAVCDAVAFFREGTVVAQGSPAELKHGLAAESVRVGCTGAPEAEATTFGRLPGVVTATVSEGEVRLTTADASSLIPALFAAAAGRIRSVAVEPTTLEDAYFHHIGRARGSNRP